MSKAHLSRRTVIAGAAATIPATAIANGIPDADAMNPDPIFAAIEAHRQAWKNLDCCSDLDAANTPEADAELERLWGAEEAARAALLVTPTTNAGAAALLRHVRAHAKECDIIGSAPLDVWVDEVHLNVADMLEGRVPS